MGNDQNARDVMTVEAKDSPGIKQQENTSAMGVSKYLEQKQAKNLHAYLLEKIRQQEQSLTNNSIYEHESSSLLCTPESSYHNDIDSDPKTSLYNSVQNTISKQSGYKKKSEVTSLESK